MQLLLNQQSISKIVLIPTSLVIALQSK